MDREAVRPEALRPHLSVGLPLLTAPFSQLGDGLMRAVGYSSATSVPLMKNGLFT
jgi:hypothetical protein